MGYGHYNSSVLLLPHVDGAIVQLSTPITIKLIGTTTNAAIFSDRAGTVKPNPFLTDAVTGTFDFYAAPGDYDLWVGTKIATITVPDDALAVESGRFIELARHADASGATPAGDILRDIVDDAEASGLPVTILARGTFRIDGPVEFPQYITVMGDGIINTTFNFYNSAKFVFGDLVSDQRRAVVGGFSITGGDASITEGMYIGISAASVYENLRFYNITGICMNICALQNSLIQNIDIATQNNIGMVFDLGCANLTMVNVHSSGRAGQEACTIIRQSGTSPPLIGVARPSKLHFYGGLHEGGCETAMKVTSGAQIDLNGVALNAATGATSTALLVAPQTGHQVSIRAHNTQFHAPSGTGIDASAGTVVLTGTCAFNDATNIKHSDSVIMRSDGTTDVRAGATSTPIVSTGTLPAGAVIEESGKRTVTLASDQTWTADITYRDIPGFYLTVLPGELYLVECDLKVDGSLPPGGFQYRWRAGPEVANVEYRAEAPAYAAGASATSPVDRSWIPTSATPTTAAQRGLIGAGSPIHHRIIARVTATATALTVVHLQARQVAANSTPSIIRLGSTITVSRRAA